jgi:hypothetical protein
METYSPRVAAATTTKEKTTRLFSSSRVVLDQDGVTGYLNGTVSPSTTVTHPLDSSAMAVSVAASAAAFSALLLFAFICLSPSLLATFMFGDEARFVDTSKHIRAYS